MSHPYIIWTMQRTGGTTLAALLAALSEHPGVEHEPFNAERLFGNVTKGWLETKDVDRLHADIEAVLEPLPVIKHCYELLPPAVNQGLMQVANAKNYRHIILDRRAETDRILSLELAKLTGAWGREATDIYDAIKRGEVKLDPINVKQSLQHMAACQQRRQSLSEQFKNIGENPFVVYFEDVYSAPKLGRNLILELLKFLKIDPNMHPDYEQLVHEALLHKGQNSAGIMDAVPNLDHAREQLSLAWNTSDFSFKSL